MKKTKPFPWVCSKCRKKAVQPSVADFSTDLDHDGKTYNVVIESLEIPKCTECNAFAMTDDVSRSITFAFREKVGLLHPEEIRAHRRALNFTQKQLADALIIAVETLSRWETGSQIQQQHYDMMLRAYFAVPEFRKFLDNPGIAGRGVVETSSSTEDNADDGQFSTAEAECSTLRLFDPEISFQDKATPISLYQAQG